MAITPQGGTTGTSLEVESATRATRTMMHGNDWQCYGSYTAGCALLATVGGISGPIWEFRFPNMAPNHVVAVRRFSICFNNTSFAAVFAYIFQLFIVRNATANGTGGAQLSTLANNSKLRTTMGGQTVIGQAGDLRFVNANAALGAITGTQDTMPIASTTIISGNTTNVARCTPQVFLFDARVGEYPIILGPNEGLNLNLLNAPAQGWNITANLSYDELVAY